MAVVAPTLILALYGSAWEPAGAVMRAASIAMLLLTFTEIASPFLWGFGKGGIDCVAHLSAAAAIAVLAVVGTPSGIATTAWLVVGVNGVRSLWLTVMAAKSLRVGSWLEILDAVLPGLLVAVPPAVAAGGLDWLMIQEGFAAWSRLTAVAVVSVPVTLGALIASRRFLSPPLRSRINWHPSRAVPEGQ
jgi:O-antigen/teichoic acid export membrane protein